MPVECLNQEGKDIEVRMVLEQLVNGRVRRRVASENQEKLARKK